MPAEDNGRDVWSWIRLVRRHHEGVMLAEDRAAPVRFVICGATGAMVMPVEGWVLGAMDAALFLPEERPDSLQVMVEFDRAEAPGGAQDRWSAYHGESRTRHWASARIVGVRCEGEVCEANELRPINALGTGEYRVLKLLNADRAGLARLCERLAKVRVPAPVAVGVDPHGIDVRAAFGVVRVEYPEEECGASGCIDCADRAAEVLRRLMGGSDA